MAAIIPAAAIGAAVGAELPKFFNDALDQFAAGEGNYLRDGEPEGIVGQVGQAVGRAYCRLIDSGNGSGQPLRDIQNEKVCRPYLESINPGGGPGLELPFRGGQCDILYNFTIRGDGPTGINGFGECAGNAPNTIPGQAWGPIGGLVRGRVVCEGGTQPIGYEWLVTCHGASSGPRQADPVQIVAASPLYTASIDGVAPVSNIPDSCGNPPPVPVIRPPGPTIQPPPFPFNPAPNVDIDVDVRIGPNGDIIFDIGAGPITIDPFPGNPGGDPGGGSGGGGPGVPGDPGNPAETGTGDGVSGQGGSAEGEAPDGSVLTGLRVDVITAPSSRTRYSPEVDRGVVYVYMGTPEGMGLETSGSMLRSGQFFFAQKDYLTKWQVRSKFGYNTLITPYYRNIEDA